MRRFILYILVWVTPFLGVYNVVGQSLGDFLPEALAGNATAQYNTSKCYAYGWGTEVNTTKATHYLRLAAENAQPRAMEEMADRYEGVAPLLHGYWDADGEPNRGNLYEGYDNGCYYGELHNYQRDGYGTYAWDSGTVYSGEWYEGERYGIGFSLFGNTVHYGNYSGEPNGHGTTIVTDSLSYLAGAVGSRVYVGDFVEGTPHGQGTLYGHDGTLLYNGEFERGVPVGTYPTQENYTPYRWSYESLPGGDSYEGETLRGVREGFGIYRWADGSMWFGYWEDGLREGEGLYINANGAMVAGIWSYGELQ